MALEICKNHPGREAIGHCETCHIPICEKCAVGADGTDRIFCSQEHAERFMSYESRRKDMKIRPKKNRSIFLMLPMWIVMAIVAIVVIMILVFLFKGIMPADQIKYLRGFLGL